MLLLKESVIAVLLGVFVMMGMFCNYSYDRIKRYQIEVLTYETKFNQFKIDSLQQEKRFEIAKAQAETELAEAKENVQKILATNVSKDCSAAMDWGLRQARDFR